MTDLPDLVRLDQPESPDRTRDLGNLLAETARALNYSTMGDAPGLENPGDAYSLLGAWYTATRLMPQLAAQLAGFLDAQARTGRLRDDQGREVRERIAAAAYWLGIARQCADEMTSALQAAQNAIAGLSAKGDGNG